MLFIFPSLRRGRENKNLYNTKHFSFNFRFQKLFSLFLLNRGIQPNVEIPQDPSSSLNPDDLESSTPPQAMLRPDSSSNLGTPTLDVFGQSDDVPPIIHKRTRSGRAYCSILRHTYHVCPPNLESAKTDSVFGANDPRHQHVCPKLEFPA